MTGSEIWSLRHTSDGAPRTHFVEYGALSVMGLLVTIAVINRYGMETFEPELFHLYSAIKHSAHYNVDPVAGTFIPSSAIFLRIFTDVYDVPFYHLLFGVLAKFLIAYAFLALTWKITRSVLSCFLAQIMLFGLANFLIVDVNIPIGYISFGIRQSLYLNFREIAMVFALLATVFFLSGRYLLSSLFLAFGFYLHPFNVMGFFVSFNAALAISFLLVKENKVGFLYAGLKLSVVFLALISPYVWMNAKLNAEMFGDVTPIPSSLWWKFILKNEPDDASFLFHVMRGGYVKELFLTILSVLLYVFLRADKAISTSNVVAFIRGKRDPVLPLLLAPWIVALFGVLWEGALVDRIPDFLNDIFVPLQFRRYPSVSAFLYIPILAAFVSQLILFLTEASLAELFGRQLHKEDRVADDKRVGTLSLDVGLGVGLAALLVISVLVRGSSKGVDLHKFWNFEHVTYDYFRPRNDSPIYRTEDDLSQAKVIPHEAFLDVGRFIRENTALEAAFFNPTYIGWFLAYSERQRFLSEKDDGNYAVFNRKLATIYLKRFSDIHKGLTYDELPGVVFGGGAPYAIMRQRYLSLSGSDVERLKMTYPGYQYFLTEVGHSLPYRKIYANDYFLIYDIEQIESNQR